MTNTMFCRAILGGILFIVFPATVLAKNTINDPVKVVTNNKLEVEITTDSIPSSKKATETKPDDNKPDIIKEVPKSHRQLKPSVVVPEIKVKPVKVIAPKIKLHVGL